MGYAEQLAHGRLAAYGFQANREFFQPPYDLAIRAVIDTCKEVNKYNVTGPVARAFINMGAQADARRMREVLEPYRGGKVQVVLAYRNENSACEVALGDAWRIALAPRLLAGPMMKNAQHHLNR